LSAKKTCCTTTPGSSIELPGWSLFRRCPPRTSISTKDQPRRPILRPLRGPKNSRQTAFRYPARGLLWRCTGEVLRPPAQAIGHCRALQTGSFGQVRRLWACCWVPEGSLAVNFRAGFPGIPCRNRPRNPVRSPGPAPHINFHERPTPQTNSKAVSRCPKLPARLPFGTQPGVCSGGAPGRC